MDKTAYLQECKARRFSVIFVMYNMEVGGAERVFLNLMNEFIKKEIAVQLITNRRTVLFDELSSEVDLTIHEIGNSKWIQIKTLAAMFRQCKPNAIITTQRHTNLLVSLAHFFARSKSTLIIREAASNINENMKSIRWFHRRLLATYLFRFAYRRSSRLIANSTGTKESLKRFQVVARDEKCCIIPNPVNLDRIRLLAEEPVHEELIENGTRLLCWIGRFVDQKRPMDMLEAFAALHQADVNMRLVMFGDGPLRKLVQDRIKKEGLNQFVSLPGKSANPFFVLKRADVFVLTSAFEGFGMVVVEALACGTPIVSANLNCGPAETLSHGKFGQLYPPGDISELVESIKIALCKRRPFEEGIARAEDFDAETIANSYIDVLRNRTSDVN